MCYHINGAIVQELNRPTGHLKIPDADYLGINAFFHDPLSDAADCKLRHIAAQAMERQYADGTFALVNFIRNADLLFNYLQACRESGVAVRVLFIKSCYDAEMWKGEMPPCRFLGYEYCEIPFDLQIITDFNWYTPLNVFYQKLNCFGLFENLEDAEQFKQAYDTAMAKGFIGDGEMDAFICEVYALDVEAFCAAYRQK